MEESRGIRIVEKPISLRIRQLKEDILLQIQSSELPPVIIEPVVKDILSVVQIEAERQFQIEQQQYNDFLVKESEKEETEEPA